MSNTAPSRADPMVVFPLSPWCPPQETSQPHPPQTLATTKATKIMPSNNLLLPNRIQNEVKWTFTRITLTDTTQTNQKAKHLNLLTPKIFQKLTPGTNRHHTGYMMGEFDTVIHNPDFSSEPVPEECNIHVWNRSDYTRAFTSLRTFFGPIVLNTVHISNELQYPWSNPSIVFFLPRGIPAKFEKDLKKYRQVSNISRTKSQHLKRFSSCLAAAFAESLEARC